MNDSITIVTPYNMNDLDQQVAELLLKPELSLLIDLQQRLFVASELFLECPYQNAPLGEGVFGVFDQNPPYRFDVFDCLTYVNTVLALAFSDDVKDFTENMRRVNYLNGDHTYFNRHHFMNIDWNVHNAALGIIEDVTELIGNGICKIAVADIDKANWFAHKTNADIKLLKKLDANDQNGLLEKLQKGGGVFEVQRSELPYIPIECLLGGEGQSLLNRIPGMAIIEIVRPNWQLKEEIGTNLNVSHLGFAVRKKGQLYFRNASLIHKKVVDELMTDYLERYLDSPTVRGVNIQKFQHYARDYFVKI